MQKAIEINMEEVSRHTFHTWSRPAAALFTAIIFLLSGCSGDKKAAEPVVSVQTVTVRQNTISSVIPGEALLTPLHQAVLAAKISAPIQHFYVQRGDKVSKGELLAVLENKDLSGAALGSQGQYQQAKAQYTTATQSTIPQEMQKAEHDVAQAKAEEDLQQRTYTSQQKLFAEGALPGRTLDQTKVALVQAQTQYGILQRNLEALKRVNHTAQLQAAAGQLHQAEGQYHQAAATLAYSEIRSPIAGYITDRPLYQGEMATAGAPILTVMDTSVLIAKAHLPQAQMQRLPLGADAHVTVPGIPDPVPGKVTLISPALDTGSTTVEVWIRIENQNNQLKPGTSVSVSITAQTIPNALVIPDTAILTASAGDTTIMVVEPDGRAYSRKVKTGIQQGPLIQILSGLKAGEEVIVSGAYGLPDKTRVKVAQPTQDQNAKASAN